MTIPLTTNGLIDSIKRKGSIPTSQETFQDQDFIDLINEEFSMYILPTILRLHQEFYAYSDESDTLVTTTKRYRIPYRAIGNKLRDLHSKTSSGQLTKLIQISADDRSLNNDYYNNPSSNLYYLEGDEIVFVDALSLSGTLVKSYYLRPNELVAESRAATITAINTTTGEVTVDTIPSHFYTAGTTTSATDIDFIGAKSPNIIKSFDISPTTVDSSTNIFTFTTTDLPSSLAVGDYIMAIGETIVPQMPSELISLLTQRVTLKCLEALGDTEAIANCQRQLDKMEANVPALINNRVEGSPKKAVNRRSILRVGLIN